MGCQCFTAGEAVSDPDPSQVRVQAPKKAASKPAARAQAAHAAHGHDAHDGHDHGAAQQQELAQASHILIRYAGSARATPDITRSKEDARALAEKVAKQAKGGADFAELANQYTEDPSGKGRGGKLPPFGRGAMVPEFDAAVFSMGAGSVSGVVETAFGFHIIYREK